MKKFIISLDFWNTIVCNISYRQTRIKIIIDYLKEKNYQNISFKQVSDSFIRVREIIDKNQINNSYYFTPIFKRIEYLMKNLGINICEQEIREIIRKFQEPVLANPPPLKYGVKNLLKKLSINAYLFCLSDTGYTTGETIIQILERYSLSQYIDNYFFSEKIGFNKPHYNMFHPIVENERNIKKNNIWHIGDKKETDIEGAILTNINSIYINEYSTYKIIYKNNLYLCEVSDINAAYLILRKVIRNEEFSKR